MQIESYFELLSEIDKISYKNISAFQDKKLKELAKFCISKEFYKTSFPELLDLAENGLESLSKQKILSSQFLSENSPPKSLNMVFNSRNSGINQNRHKQSYDLLFARNFELDNFLQESIKKKLAPYLFFIKKNIPICNIDKSEYLTPDLSFKEVEHLDNIDQSLVREAIYSSMIYKYSQLYSEQEKSNFIKLHLPALDKTLNQKYILCYQGNNLVAFISWFNLNFLNKFNAIVSTHWMSQSTDFLVRKKIHKYFFNHLNSISTDFMAASIFFQNTTSIDFFKRNNYSLFSLKVLNL